jgi:hypothetical protein
MTAPSDKNRCIAKSPQSNKLSLQPDRGTLPVDELKVSSLLADSSNGGADAERSQHQDFKLPT